MSRRVVVIGGGIAGLTAARRRARGGDAVTVLESAPTLGGLVAGFEVGDQPLERYYHYTLPQESHIQALLGELGLLEDLEWFSGTIAVLTGGKVWPFTTPLDLLRFRPLDLPDRVRAGIGALRLGQVRDWPDLDEVSAVDWLTGLTSQGVTDVVWTPLLRAKFGPAAEAVPAAWMWSRLNERRQAHKGSSEQVGYLRGGYGRLFEKLAEDIEAHGGTVRTSTPARRLALDGTRVTGVVTDEGTVPCDVAIYAGQLPRLGDLVPSEHHDPRWAASALGAVCMVLQLTRPMTKVFWTNVCDRDLPFGGIIEHTNLVPAAWYGRHVAYVSRYFTHAEAIATAELNGVRDEWVEALLATFPHLHHDDIAAVDVFRTSYAAPLVSVPYLPQIPPAQSHLEGLVLATTAQVYPQDRGMDQGVRSALVVDEILDGADRSCPVCDRTERREVFAPTSAGGSAAGGADMLRPTDDHYEVLTHAVVECASCGHRWTDLPRTVVDGRDRYHEVVDEQLSEEEQGQRATARRALERIEEEVGAGRILDVGCWTGAFLAEAVDRGWTAVGIEPSAWAAERARDRGLDVLESDLLHTVLPAGSFEAVAMSDVLEHLVDPAAAVRRARELLAPGGVLYVAAPDAGSLIARALGRRWWAILPMHLQYFTRSSLRLLLARNGFEVRLVATHPKAFSVQYYGRRAASYLPRAGGLIDVVLRTRRASRVVAPDLRDRMQIVAVRREKADGGPR